MQKTDLLAFELGFRVSHPKPDLSDFRGVGIMEARVTHLHQQNTEVDVILNRYISDLDQLFRI